jgi:hypothetical protein
MSSTELYRNWRFEVLTSMSIKVTASWDEALCSMVLFYPEYGGNMLFRNISTQVQN